MQQSADVAEAKKRLARQRGSTVPRRASRELESDRYPVDGAVVTFGGWRPVLCDGLADRLRETSVVLRGVPMPPTDNHGYITVARGKRAPSPQATEFRAKFQHWAIHNLWSLRRAAQLAACFDALAVDVYVGFAYSRIYAKAGTLKKCDATNRHKLLLDCLGTAVGYDDKHFFEVRIAKYPIDADASESCTLVVRPATVLSSADIDELVASAPPVGTLFESMSML